MSARAPTSSIAELRATVQPPGVMDRSVEHWVGRLYMRRVSPYLTFALLRTPITPNGVTWLMISSGVLAAVALTLPGLGAALAAAGLIQLQLLFDCCDGELARWQQRRSTTGIYLDHIGHYVTEAALPIALGVHADGSWHSVGGYTTLGLVVAVLVLLVKGETALVHVARAEAGDPAMGSERALAQPRPALLRRARRAIGFVPFFRAFNAVEASLLVLAAALIDQLSGGLAGSRALVIALLVAAAITAAGHLIAVVASDRLR